MSFSTYSEDAILALNNPQIQALTFDQLWALSTNTNVKNNNLAQFISDRLLSYTPQAAYWDYLNNTICPGAYPYTGTTDPNRAHRLRTEAWARSAVLALGKVTGNNGGRGFTRQGADIDATSLRSTAVEPGSFEAATLPYVVWQSPLDSVLAVSNYNQNPLAFSVADGANGLSIVNQVGLNNIVNYAQSAVVYAAPVMAPTLRTSNLVGLDMTDTGPVISSYQQMFASAANTLQIGGSALQGLITIGNVLKAPTIMSEALDGVVVYGQKVHIVGGNLYTPMIDIDPYDTRGNAQGAAAGFHVQTQTELELGYNTQTVILGRENQNIFVPGNLQFMFGSSSITGSSIAEVQTVEVGQAQVFVTANADHPTVGAGLSIANKSKVVQASMVMASGPSSSGLEGWSFSNSQSTVFLGVNQADGRLSAGAQVALTRAGSQQTWYGTKSFAAGSNVIVLGNSVHVVGCASASTLNVHHGSVFDSGLEVTKSGDQNAMDVQLIPWSNVSVNNDASFGGKLQVRDMLETKGAFEVTSGDLQASAGLSLSQGQLSVMKNVQSNGGASVARSVWIEADARANGHVSVAGNQVLFQNSVTVQQHLEVYQNAILQSGLDAQQDMKVKTTLQVDGFTTLNALGQCNTLNVVNGSVLEVASRAVLQDDCILSNKTSLQPLVIGNASALSVPGYNNVIIWGNLKYTKAVIVPLGAVAGAPTSLSDLPTTNLTVMGNLSTSDASKVVHLNCPVTVKAHAPNVLANSLSVSHDAVVEANGVRVTGNASVGGATSVFGDASAERNLVLDSAQGNMLVSQNFSANEINCDRNLRVVHDLRTQSLEADGNRSTVGLLTVPAGQTIDTSSGGVNVVVHGTSRSASSAALSVVGNVLLSGNALAGDSSTGLVMEALDSGVNVRSWNSSSLLLNARNPDPSSGQASVVVGNYLQASTVYNYHADLLTSKHLTLLVAGDSHLLHALQADGPEARVKGNVYANNAQVTWGEIDLSLSSSALADTMYTIGGDLTTTTSVSVSVKADQEVTANGLQVTGENPGTDLQANLTAGATTFGPLGKATVDGGMKVTAGSVNVQNSCSLVANGPVYFNGPTTSVSGASGLLQLTSTASPNALSVADGARVVLNGAVTSVGGDLVCAGNVVANAVLSVEGAALIAGNWLGSASATLQNGLVLEAGSLAYTPVGGSGTLSVVQDLRVPTAGLLSSVSGALAASGANSDLRVDGSMRASALSVRGSTAAFNGSSILFNGPSVTMNGAVSMGSDRTWRVAANANVSVRGNLDTAQIAGAVYANGGLQADARLRANRDVRVVGTNVLATFGGLSVQSDPVFNGDVTSTSTVGASRLHAISTGSSVQAGYAASAAAVLAAAEAKAAGAVRNTTLVNMTGPTDTAASVGLMCQLALSSAVDVAFNKIYNDALGSTFSASFPRINGTDYGPTVFSNSADYPGPNGKSYAKNASILYSKMTAAQMTNMTTTMWVKCDKPSSGACININLPYSSDIGFYYSHDADLNMDRFYIGYARGSSPRDSPALYSDFSNIDYPASHVSSNNWHHVAMVMCIQPVTDHPCILFYVDGQNIGYVRSPGVVYNNTQWSQFVNYYSQSTNNVSNAGMGLFNGANGLPGISTSEVQFYNQALGPAQISQLFALGIAQLDDQNRTYGLGAPNEAVAYGMPLPDSMIDFVYDNTGTSGNMQVIGGYTYSSSTQQAVVVASNAQKNFSAPPVFVAGIHNVSNERGDGNWGNTFYFLRDKNNQFAVNSTLNQRAVAANTLTVAAQDMFVQGSNPGALSYGFGGAYNFISNAASVTGGMYYPDQTIGASVLNWGNSTVAKGVVVRQNYMQYLSESYGKSSAEVSVLNNAIQNQLCVPDNNYQSFSVSFWYSVSSNGGPGVVPNYQRWTYLCNLVTPFINNPNEFLGFKLQYASPGYHNLVWEGGSGADYSNWYRNFGMYNNKGGPTLTDAGWHQITMTFDARALIGGEGYNISGNTLGRPFVKNNISIYVDGQLAYMFSPLTNTNNRFVSKTYEQMYQGNFDMLFGTDMWVSGHNLFAGEIAGLSYYSTLLTSHHVALLYNIRSLQGFGCDDLSFVLPVQQASIAAATNTTNQVMKMAGADGSLHFDQPGLQVFVNQQVQGMLVQGNGAGGTNASAQVTGSLVMDSAVARLSNLNAVQKLTVSPDAAASLGSAVTYANVLVSGNWQLVKDLVATSNQTQITFSAMYGTNGALLNCQTSDRRIKTNVTDADLSACMASLLTVRLRLFSYTADYLGAKVCKNAVNLDGLQLGCIADELAESHPYAVKDSGSFVLGSGAVIQDLKTISMNRQLYELVGAVQWLDRQVSMLEAVADQ